MDSSEKVSFLINQELCVREEDLPPLDNDEYYDYQLIGLHVTNHKDDKIGMVTQVIHTGANSIIVVTGKEEILVPMVEGIIVRIDLEDSFIAIDEEALSRMIFSVLTLFPGIFDSPLQESITKKAVEKGLVKLQHREYQGFCREYP